MNQKKSNCGFQFKQFFIAHDQCAMKVGTDSILLGAWTNVTNVKHILDLGTGSGLLAIMLAQRTPNTCQIEAIEIEQQAYQQALTNAQNCLWSDRIHILHSDIMKYQPNKSFDLIITNPPYFLNSVASRSLERDIARTLDQEHIHWLMQAKRWLTPLGKITMVLPLDKADRLIKQALGQHIFCTDYCQIIPKCGKPAKRVLLAFCLQQTRCNYQQITIYQDNNTYTPEFRKLTQDFYLHTL